VTSAKQYEPGMRITFDPATKRARVAFRGRLIELPGSFDTELDAVRAGEEHCKRNGWVERPEPTNAESLLKHRKTTRF
jgi:hypothetical protein